MSLSRSLPNCANDCNSRYWLYTSFSLPATCFMALICALPPTRDTEMPGLTAGKMPAWNSSVSKKICPSVMEMTLVGMYAETSPACVSMMGSAVRLPPPYSGARRAARSNRRLCR